MNPALIHRSRKEASRAFAPVLAAVLLLFVSALSATATTLGPSLAAKLGHLAGSDSAGTVIVAFNTTNGLTPANLATLTLAGITRGYTLPHLGMVAAPATAAQVRALAANPTVRSIWANDRLHYLNDQTRVLTGTDRMRTDPGFIQRNQGLPVSGKGNFSLLINDSGIDGTHPDLHYPDHLIQNVQGITDTGTLTGFTPALYVENVPDTDTNVGHGTHCAGIAAGTGAASGGKYAGVAPGANLIGYGSGAVLLILNGLGGFEYALANQSRYNIRIISNSWGGSGAFDPNSPVAIASKAAHDHGIVVVFAAGNSGPGKDTMGPESKAPWVISVAAGTKEGGLASFSSRGVPKSQRPNDDFNAPTITAPGTGREFASDSGRFTSDVVSTRAKTNIFANGEISQADAELAPGDLPFYTEISGTSMATPFVAGTVALLLSADPTLSPDDVKSILTRTASQMPGYSEFEVGAGYVNVYAAVDKTFNRSKPYGTYGGPLDLQHYNLQITTTTVNQAPFHIDYNPASTPGPGSVNSTSFTVQAGISVLDVFATIDDVLATGNGNTVGLLLTAPDGKTYSSGIALPILDAPNREVVVKNPLPGPWLLEVRGVRGLAALPEVSLPTSGAALPGPVAGTITQQVTTLPAIADVQGDPSQAEIEFVLKNRMMDVTSDGLFHPADSVTRGDFARALVFNTALRQSLADSPRYTDTSGPSDDAIAEAVTANGSTLRDYDFTPTGMVNAQGSGFSASGEINYTELAVALIKALGLDAAALAKAGTDVTVTYNGQPVVVSDEGDIPAGLRGYVQLALDRGILNPSFSFEQNPGDPQPHLVVKVRPINHVTRSVLAFALDHYRQAFAAGN
ncbi:MAG: serine protease AprX [Acidobacteriota bacterium]|jgi:serine protease AprX|nr:serine protease AprX [Acidobacteriota bacterium]